MTELSSTVRFTVSWVERIVSVVSAELGLTTKDRPDSRYDRGMMVRRDHCIALPPSESITPS